MPQNPITVGIIGAVPGFPNFFMLYGPNTNVGANSAIFVLEAQARYVVRALRYLRRKRNIYVAVRPEAMTRRFNPADFTFAPS